MITEIEKQFAFQIQPLLSIDMDILDGKEFEKYCADLLKELKYTNIKFTPVSGDYGIDILAEKDDLIYGFQCKCYSGNIGVKAVQEVSSGSIYYNCDRAIVITNNYFTPAAINMAKRIGVILWNRKDIEELLQEVLDNTIEKINRDEKLRAIKIQKEKQENEEKLKYEKLFDQQFKMESLRLKQRKEKELEAREINRKQEKKLFIKIASIMLCFLIIFMGFEIFESKVSIKKNINMLDKEVRTVSQEYDFSITNIQVDMQKNIYECKISSSDFSKLSPETMYLFYEELSNQVKTLNFSSSITKIECAESDYTFSASTVKKNGNVIYDQLKEEKKKKEKEMKEKYSHTYPQLGMREEALYYTILGKPDRITKCKDFDYLVPRAQSKKYEWGQPLKPGYFSVEVWYRKYLSHKCDDYEEYPPNNGYVFSIYYYDKNGKSHSLDMLN